MENQASQQPISSCTETRNLEQEYLNTLTPKEMKSYLIAKDHLGSTFDLKKAIGFLEWKKKEQK
jgi:hypothetical protein